ncbi:protein of unknown function [Latilactobacillus sakei]|nr:protein of unknown function [Latilactobacillus sakei]
MPSNDKTNQGKKFEIATNDNDYMNKLEKTTKFRVMSLSSRAIYGKINQNG